MPCPAAELAPADSSSPRTITLRGDLESDARSIKTIDVATFLSTLGVVPDQVSPDAMIARIEAGMAQDLMDAKRQTARYSDILSQSEMKPFYIYPVEIWLTDPGLALVNTLGLWPSGSWNRVFLPVDGTLAAVLNCVPHPNEVTSEQSEFAARVMALVHAKIDAVTPLFEQARQDAKFAASDIRALIDKKRALENLVKDSGRSFFQNMRLAWRIQAANVATEGDSLRPFAAASPDQAAQSIRPAMKRYSWVRPPKP